MKIKLSERKASLCRKAGSHSRYQRCPKCKKLRMKWMPINNWDETYRKRWGRLNGELVCHICIERANVNGIKSR